MMAKLRGRTIQQWFADFVDALQETQYRQDAASRVTDRRDVAAPLGAIQARGIIAAYSAQSRCTSCGRDYAPLIGSSSNTTRHRERRNAPCSARSDFPSAPTPLPWPTNTPGPTITDDLLPMMTLGCGEARFDARAVGPDDRIAGTDAAPAVVAGHVGALAGAGLAPARARRRTAISADIRDRNTSARLIVMPPSGLFDCRHRSIVAGPAFRFNSRGRRRPRKWRNYPLYSIACGNSAVRAPRSLAKSALPLQERASGEMAEWLKAHAWKACVRETVPWVRIPLSPPAIFEAPFSRHIRPKSRVFFRCFHSR